MEKTVIHHFSERSDIYEYREYAKIDTDFQGMLLDIGCGAYPTFSLEVEYYVGLDLNPKLISIFKKNHESVLLLIGDALSLPFRFNVFRNVGINVLLHHLIGNSPKNSINKIEILLTQIKYILKKEGLCIIRELISRNIFYTYVMFYTTLFLSKINMEVSFLNITQKVIVFFSTEKILNKITHKHRMHLNEISYKPWRVLGILIGKQAIFQLSK